MGGCLGRGGIDASLGSSCWSRASGGRWAGSSFDTFALGRRLLLLSPRLRGGGEDVGVAAPCFVLKSAVDYGHCN